MRSVIAIQSNYIFAFFKLRMILFQQQKINQIIQKAKWGIFSAFRKN